MKPKPVPKRLETWLVALASLSALAAGILLAARFGGL